ncbi:MAG: calcium-binding protein [Leptolyngbyaceae bacterium]|nr:calcium-binding protein [Leptolyngbyaceae bacterium]
MGILGLNPIQGSGFIQGTLLDDYMTGSAFVDVIRADQGNDIVFGGDGGDEIDGQSGDDILLGGNGEDQILGGEGNDILFGGTTTTLFLINALTVDALTVDAIDDVLVGGAGSDRLVGGIDTADGYPDADYLVGTDYAAAGIGEVDILRGGSDGDTFVLAETKEALELDALRIDELTGQVVNQKLYYLDPMFGSGTEGYAVIEDFQPDEGDKIQLLAPEILAGDDLFVRNRFYKVGASPLLDVPGSAIYVASAQAPERDDLVAIVQFEGQPELQVNLGASYINYVGAVEPSQPFPRPVEPPIDVLPGLLSSYG